MFLERVLICLLLVLVVPVATASTSDYQVEVIIFEHLFHDADGEISETGLDLPDPPAVIHLDELQDNDASGFKPLSPGLYKLGGVYNELKFSREYRPVLHLAWRQPALNQSRARYVNIRKALSETGPDSNPDQELKIDGLIRIRSSQFLHADVDLFYFVNPVSESFLRSRGTASSLESPGGLRFAELKETRRMKLNELHYFDHPVFGLFLRVSRIKD